MPPVKPEPPLLTAQVLTEDRFAEGAELIGPVTPSPVRRRKSEEVQARLLDTAEYLFAKFGYAAVSIRDVTARAEMRLANVSYYFGSKQNLYYEVLRRRSEPLIRRRIERIRAVRRGRLQGEARLAALVDAYADPALELSQGGDPGWKNFFALIGQVTFSGLAPPQIGALFNASARELMGAFYEIYPAAPAAKVQAAAMLLIGPYIFTLSETGRIETFAEAAYASGDLDFLGPLMKRFIVRGVEGILGPARGPVAKGDPGT
jgi:AcrR family transcriptional regulator